MSGIAELITVSARWRDWEDPRFVVCILSNGDLAEVTWEQRETERGPRNAPSQNLPHFPFAKYAELLGLRSIEVDDPNALEGAWKEAFSADRPVVIDVRTDPTVPLLPPFPSGEFEMPALASCRCDGARDATAKEQLLGRS